VTQGIQTVPPTVRLVERKPTVVRVMARHGLNGFGVNQVEVRGRVRVFRPGGLVSPWFDAANGTDPMQASPGTFISLPADPKRNDTDDTLNFLIPPEWCIGAVLYDVEVRTYGFGSVGSFLGFDDIAKSKSGPYLFEPRRVLEFRYIKVNWGANPPPFDQGPSDTKCLETLRGAVPLLPTPVANIAPLGGVGVQVTAGMSKGDRRALLGKFHIRHNCLAWAWLGWGCPEDDGTIWVLMPEVLGSGPNAQITSEAATIPGNVCFVFVDYPSVAAHEVAHCYGQTHIRFTCGNGVPEPEGGDSADLWPAKGRLGDVPFNSLRNVALSLAGAGVYDLMTYCPEDNQWPLPERWKRLWDQIGS
jgi:hypothetical protein